MQQTFLKSCFQCYRIIGFALPAISRSGPAPNTGLPTVIAHSCPLKALDPNGADGTHFKTLELGQEVTRVEVEDGISARCLSHPGGVVVPKVYLLHLKRGCRGGRDAGEP